MRPCDLLFIFLDKAGFPIREILLLLFEALLLATGGGWLAKLEELGLQGNEYGEEGAEALAAALDTGKLPSLMDLWTDPHPVLEVACAKRGVRFNGETRSE